MNIQVFTLRTNPDFFQSDQKKLNDFLQEIVYIKSSEYLVESGLDAPYWSILLHYEVCETRPSGVKIVKEKIKEVEESDLTPGAQYILECLKDWRTDKANELKVPKYMVCHNSELINIAFHQPTTMEALKNIKGFGEKKAQRFGEDIIALLNAV
ncbi:HRDC domain-containing protein [Flavobacterium suncheonense]|uniref:HRDC domain-containing protein n=1 Tax=Flavobacterium suncheonense GH29-5 = DSM 17707 TaxID=1121899 RepID=A0A0A2MFF2_9FLAO|nr:HRDC domain-containing protein [Flavobacterium suncheonense]KGO90321.1 hypothetical protein Q764_01870 [Flavobacterium suncheonense GH29-5 = DSM 17707]